MRPSALLFGLTAIATAILAVESQAGATWERIHGFSCVADAYNDYLSTDYKPGPSLGTGYWVTSDRTGANGGPTPIS